jgi:purine-binding chemotaxis protein CheW
MTMKTEATLQGNPADAAQVLKGGKFLTFYLGEEEYALEILKVQEIIGLMSITPVPKTPESVLGIINLRGKIIPVLDLRRKFEMVSVDHDDLTCIVVMQVSEILVGILVDRVNEVSDLDESHLQGMPEINSGPMSECLLGVGKIDDRVLMLLNIEQVLDREALMKVAQKAEANTDEESVK